MAAGVVLALIAPVQAQISTTDLFAHYDADYETYYNAPKRNSLPGILALNGERVWEWWDQTWDGVSTSGAWGNQTMQNIATGIQPILHVGVLNGHNYLGMALVEGSSTSYLLAPEGGAVAMLRRRVMV